MIEKRHDEYEICACCGRQSAGLGISGPRWKSPMLWVCDDPECIKIAKDTYAMKQDEFNRIESLAAGQGGAEAGKYLEQIGKTDLATLLPEEWFEFCRRVVAGYRKALKGNLKDEAPF